MFDITNLKAGSDPVGLTINTISRTAPYKVYEGTITAGTSPLILNLFSDLGTVATRGFIYNADSANSILISFSVDGTNYGDNLTVEGGMSLEIDIGFSFEKLKITRVSADVAYKIFLA